MYSILLECILPGQLNVFSLVRVYTAGPAKCIQPNLVRVYTAEPANLVRVYTAEPANLVRVYTA